MMIATKRNLQRELLEPAAFVTAAIGRLSESGAAERGAIFTRREVVEFILDLVGYTSEKPLWTLRVLEPSFGLGDFLEVVVLRLVESWKRHGKNDSTLLDSAVVGIEVHRETFLETGGKLRMQLEALGLARTDAARLVKRWLHCDDFLMRHFDENVDVVVGNPPYLRPEAIPNALLAEYRRQFVTMYDRADLYVPFIEKALSLLDEGGNLGFICSDRWMKNKYGGPLREMVSRDFHLKYYVDMVDTPAFTSDVTAYPAITVISKEHGEATRIAHRPEISAAALTELVAKLTGGAKGLNGAVQEIRAVMSGAEPWVLESDSLEGLSLVRKLEARFPTIEETGCKVGIGVATGADDVFIGAMEDLDVEESRKVPLVATRDIAAGHVEWRGLGVINPFGEDGKPVRLEDFPKLKRYFETHGAVLRKRHVAKREGGCWYRTIDKITPSLAATPKLLIPDIKGTAHVVYEEGRLYPHHNLYFIVSDEWHLKALQAVLMSGLARLFVRTYSTKMRGGCLRFQAQYLRRIRLPHWSEIPRKLRDALIAAADAGNEKSCNRVVAEIFGLSHKEQKLIEQN
jgi:hypothetical protein